ncbi:polyprotein [Phytophthora megakarya]|uniref:Polyprotein n=1 Tax=Phytophthora megakarya TaxID=4795 RepID=A0A225WN44_9STRA|nr:polyprotein [Phytophthora megakarya]
MRMTLARNVVLEHVQVVKDPAEMTEAWPLNDMKALDLIAQGVSVEHHTKIENSKDVALIYVKEKFLKEYERQQKETLEHALKATSFAGKSKSGKFGKVGKGYDCKSNSG